MMKIQTKILLLTGSMVVIAMAVALGISSFLMQEALDSAAKRQLVAVMEDRHSAIMRRFETMQAELDTLSTSEFIARHLPALCDGFASLGRNAQTILQQTYLPKGDASALPSTPYDQVIELATAYFGRNLSVYGWADLLLVDPQGNVVFSMQRQTDFATNLVTGPWKDTGLARAVLPLLHDAVPGALSFADYSHYPPIHNAATSFLAMPIFDQGKRRFLGVVAIRLRDDQLNKVTQDDTGMGASGEVFVVGQGGWMLSNSRFGHGKNALEQQIDTEVSRRVLSGKSGELLATDYRGIEIVAVFKPLLPFPGALGDRPRWGMIAKIDHAEALAEFERLRHSLLLVGGVLLVLALLGGYRGARSITLPLLGIKEALAKSARGEDTDVPGLERHDEIGDMAKAAESFRKITEQIGQDHWLAENVMALTNAASAENSVEHAADQVLRLLCDRLQVPVGAIYLGEEGRFQRVSAHGLARRSQSEDRFELGEGVLGQCARDGQAMVLSPVPSGLAIISTGLAEFPPHELVLYPLRHKNEVLAVLELAATSSLDPRQHELLKTATETLGLHFANLQASEHNAALLQETRKQAEALRTRSLYGRSLIESSLDPLVTIGADGKIMDVNSATEKVTGVKREGLIGSDFSDYFTEPEMARSGYQLVFTQGFVTDYPLAIRHTSGKITDVLYNASVFRDAQGEVAGIFAAARDVTEKNKAETRLREQQDDLLRSNEEMRALTEELRSQSEEMKAQNEELKASQEEMRAQQEEVQHKNQVLEHQGRQLEELIAEANSKAEALSRANQYKSEFLANMSHELRTPLNSVMILSKNLAENEDKNLTPDQVESATVINESGAQLLTLINDILDLSKIEAGKLDLQKESFPLEEMLTYLRRVFLPQAENKRIAFTIEVDPALPETLRSDRQRLTQVLSNLLSNAIKFTDAGEVKLAIRKLGHDLQLEVIDTGIGIPVDKLEHIFGAFQQVDGSTSRKYGGSGLGLAISRHLARLLGGDISVESQPGKGSRFVIRLSDQFSQSAPPQQPGKPQALPANPVSTPSPEILVVEDDVHLLAILGKMVKTLGYSPICVESAQPALEAVARQLPAGILLDLGLPGMSGMALLRRLRADAATARLPVFIMSGAVDSGEARTLGALGYLKKPVSRDGIAAAIQEMLQENRPSARKQVLLVDAVQSEIDSIEPLFLHDPVDFTVARTGAEATQLLLTRQIDSVILSLDLPDMTGQQWLKKVCGKLNPPPLIVFSASDLSEDEVFELKEVAESILGMPNEHLREVVLHAMQGSPIATQKLHVEAGAKATKLLLVDDDARNLFALTKVLRARGYLIEVAPDGARALELLSEGNYAAVLTDIMMPEIDGYELIRRVRRLGHLDLPIIAITAKAMQGDAELCMQAGASAYLAKPVEIESLMALLHSLGC